MTVAKIMDIISRLSVCGGQAAGAVSAYTQVKMEDAPKLLKIPISECPDIRIRLPRHKWPKSWSSMEDPVVPLERNLYGHPLAGPLWERQFEKILLQYGWDKGFQLGMLIRTLWKRIILICVCGWHQIGWKETEHWSDVESTKQRSRFGRSKIFPWSCMLGMHSKTMWNRQRYYGQLQSHVWIQNFRCENWKTSILWEFSYFFMVLWYGRSCEEMCGTILWVSKQDDSRTLQSICSMHWWPPLWRRENEICRRIVTSVLSNCLELILGTNWETWYSMFSVNKTCTIDYIMDQNLWQTPEPIDILHSSHMLIQTVLLCG